MKITLLPTTAPGRWSPVLALGVLALFFIVRKVAMIMGHGPGNETFFSNPYAALSLFAWLCGAGAFFTGVIAFIKGKERSILTGLAALFGLLVLTWGIGEVVAPH
jgi:hypothetical protein